jgi:hypothetical protein
VRESVCVSERECVCMCYMRQDRIKQIAYTTKEGAINLWPGEFGRLAAAVQTLTSIVQTLREEGEPKVHLGSCV